jgi:replicative superfamily II helicase
MDEMHALGALFNGYLLEILISKILFLEHRVADYSALVREGQQTNQRPGSAPTPLQAGLLPVRIQLIAMSATVGNVSELAAWFGKSEPFISDYRPVVLFEKIVAGDQCCNREGNVIVEKLPVRMYSDLPGR